MGGGPVRNAGGEAPAGGGVVETRRAKARSWQPPADLPERLLAYLRRTLGASRIGYAEPPVRIGVHAPGKPVPPGAAQAVSGTDAALYRFRLDGGPAGLRQAAVLRLFSPGRDAQRTVREGLVQDAVLRLDYPTPRIHAVCTDPSPLGGSFLVMEYLPGEPLLSAASPVALAGMTGRIHALLHGLDPAPFVAACAARGWQPQCYRLDPGADLDRIEDWARRHVRFRPVIDWLSNNRPGDPERLAICHGDFHPINILVRNGEITGVLDWSDAIVGDPAHDVAGTTVSIAIVGRHVLGLPQADRIADDYLDRYRSRRPVDAGRLAYYRVRHCLVRLAEGAAGWPIWSQPAVTEALVSRIGHISGVEVPAATRAREAR